MSVTIQDVLWVICRGLTEKFVSPISGLSPRDWESYCSVFRICRRLIICMVVNEVVDSLKAIKLVGCFNSLAKRTREVGQRYFRGCCGGSHPGIVTVTERLKPRLRSSYLDDGVDTIYCVGATESLRDGKDKYIDRCRLLISVSWRRHEPY